MVIDKSIIEQAFFQDEAFEQTWVEIKQEYEMLGFRDDIEDETMIAEFKYIAQQLRKYKFSKQDQILSHDTVEGMLKEIEDLIGKAAEYGNSRMEVVYNFLRDHWLVNMYNALARVTLTEEDKDE